MKYLAFTDYAAVGEGFVIYIYIDDAQNKPQMLDEFKKRIDSFYHSGIKILKFSDKKAQQLMKMYFKKSVLEDINHTFSNELFFKFYHNYS